MKNKIENFNNTIALITLIISFSSLVISIILLYTSNTLFNMERKERLLITVGSKEFGTLNYICDDGKSLLEYTMEISIQFVNNSKLPIYVERGEVSKFYSFDVSKFYDDVDDSWLEDSYDDDHYDDVDDSWLEDSYDDDHVHSDIEESYFPIYIGPQDIKQVDCKIQIQIPEIMTDYILKEFTDVEKLDICEIEDLLFFKIHTDIIGDGINIYIEDGIEKYEYKYRPFYLYFYSSRGNCFSTYYFAKSYFSSKADKIIYFKEDWLKRAYVFIRENIVMVLFLLIVMFFSIFAIIYFRKNCVNNTSQENIKS